MLKFKIINLLRNFGWMIGCYFVFFMMLGLLTYFYPGFDLKEYQQNDINRILLESPLHFVLLAVVIAPVIEEGMFRTLVRPTTNDLIFFLSCWLLIGVSFFIPEEIFWAIKFSFLGLFLLFSFIVLRELIPIQWQWKLCTILRRYQVLIWLLTSVVFGMIHIFNYVEGFEVNFVLLLLIFPRIIAGIFFGKIKIENRNLIWPITMHAMNNGTVLLFLLPQFL